jgi:hypothetical protein
MTLVSPALSNACRNRDRSSPSSAPLSPELAIERSDRYADEVLTLLRVRISGLE